MKERGFTLVELLVALFIFGILAASGVALLSFSVRAQASADGKLDEVASLRRVGALMTGDLGQAVPRIGRDALGARVAAFQGQSGSDGGAPLMTFTRAGLSNGADAPRSSLQRVEYRLAEGRLERIAYAMLDGSEARPPAVLLEGVSAVRMLYRKDGDWLDRWAETRADALPRAVDMVVTLDGTEVRQVFVVGSAYRQ